MSIDIKIHGTGTGLCALSGRDGEGMTVTFGDGTLKEGFLSYKAFQALIRMKLNQNGSSQTKAIPTAKPAEVK